MRTQMWEHGNLATPKPQPEAGGGVYHGFTNKMSSRRAMDYIKGIDVFSSEYLALQQQGQPPNKAPTKNVGFTIEPQGGADTDGDPAPLSQNQTGLEDENMQEQPIIGRLHQMAEPQEIISFLNAQGETFDWSALSEEGSEEVFKIMKKAYVQKYTLDLTEQIPGDTIDTDVYRPKVVLAALWGAAKKVINTEAQKAKSTTHNALQQLESTILDLQEATYKNKQNERKVSMLEKTNKPPQNN